MIDYVRNNMELILAAFGQHIALALIPVVIGVIVALPLGYLAVRHDWLYQPLITVSGVLYSIPSLALFVALPLIIGTKVLSPLNIIVALAIYTVALMVRSVADALRSVDRNVTQAATAMGYRPLKRLFGVDLPIATPVILAGVRVATVSNISLVSVGAIIGVGGLGALFTRGLQLRFPEPIIVGIVLSVILAAVTDSLIVLAQRYLTPWARLGGRT
ncbi:MAG: ABC transporter permease [Actinomycetota bacterium]|nr:ABC transporter permease [Actinomycetota bacterium]